MDFDAAAARGLWGVDVTVAGTTQTIPPLPALDWLEALDGGAWTDVIPGLLEGDDLDAAFVAGEVNMDEARAAARRVLTEVAGVKWSVAAALIGVGRHPILAGRLILAGLDLTRISLGAYVVACYSVATRDMTREQMATFDLQLAMPPAGAAPEDYYDEDEAEAHFLAAMSSTR